MSNYPDERRLAPERYKQNVKIEAGRMEFWETRIAMLDAAIIAVQGNPNIHPLSRLWLGAAGVTYRAALGNDYDEELQNRIKRMTEWRNQLQKRYSEETSIISWAEPDGYRLPDELCKKIAAINNNMVEDWDKPLVDPKIYPGKFPTKETPQPSNMRQPPNKRMMKK